MDQESLRQKIRSNPDWFFSDILGDAPWEKQADIIRAISTHPRVTVRSCHASGKSHVAARIVLWFMFAHKPATVLTTAPTFRQVEGVLWREMRSAFQKAKLPLGGNMLTTRYELAPDWFALGLSTDEPDKFQGYHSPNILVVPDESAGIPPVIFEGVEGVLSSGNAKMLLIGNPTDPASYFAESFKSPVYEKITISCFDTPNFKVFQTLEALRNSTQDQREQAVTHPYLISPQWAYERLLEWGEESPMFIARVLGDFPPQSDTALIQLSWMERANQRFDTILEAEGSEQFGVDVARFGSDKTVIYHRKGNRVWLEAEYGHLDTMDVTGRIVSLAKQYPAAMFAVDEIGVGAGVVDRSAELGVTNVVGINVGITSTQEDMVNLRAQGYWNLREKLSAGEIQIQENDTLTHQLTSLTFKYTSGGKIQIESKEDMKKRGLKSPDHADALMLTFMPLEAKQTFSWGAV